MCYSQVWVVGDFIQPSEFILHNDDNCQPSAANRHAIAKAITEIVQNANGPVSVYHVSHCHIADSRKCDCAEQNLELIAMYGNQ